MSELLIEIGCEEIPASYIEKGVQQLLDLLIDQLKDHYLSVQSFQTYCTPRRLIVQLQGIPSIQPEQIEKQRGPTLKVAYDSTGQPTLALMGFCKSQNLSIENITKEGEHIWCIRTLPGKPAHILLQEILVKVLGKMQFPKNMRWGEGKNKFARPIRWILAVFNKELIPFSFAGIESGLESKGHRFKNPEFFQALSLNQLLNGLRERFVEPDPKVRMEKIKNSAHKSTHYSFSASDELIYENAFLTEWPECIECQFDPSFLDLPPEVLTTTMIKHLRFFPLYDQDKITNRTLSVMNNGDLETVKSGNEWILNARFNDARFFYQEDRRNTLNEFLEKTKNIVYQNELGSVRQKAERLQSLCELIAEKESFTDLSHAGQAGLYAKSDLTTGLVSELPELQGVIAGLYAEREGFNEEVCQAFKNQYNLSRALEEKRPLSIYLILADQIDKLVGYLSIGILPKGSSDPFALRKAITSIILLNSSRKDKLTSLLPLFEKARELYAGQGFIFDSSYQKHLEELFVARYKSLAHQEGGNWNWQEGTEINYLSLLEAALSDCDEETKLSPEKVLFKLNVLSHMQSNEAFVHAATRCINIYRSSLEKNFNMKLELSYLNSSEGELLHEKLIEIKSYLEISINKGDVKLFVENITKITQYIHVFFENNMIIAEDIKNRESRLGLIQSLYKLLMEGGDFSKILPI